MIKLINRIIVIKRKVIILEMNKSINNLKKTTRQQYNRNRKTCKDYKAYSRNNISGTQKRKTREPRS
jgi:hypothetical protein